MKLLLAIFALVAVIQAEESGESGMCLVPGVENIEDYGDYGEGGITNTVSENHKGPLLRLKRGTITDIKSDEYYDEDVTASIEGDEIVFKLSDEYNDYDFDYNTFTGNDVEFFSSFQLSCPEGVTYLYFTQIIEDLNTHKPVFNRKKYTYKFGMDVAAGFDLTRLVEIFAVDLDFSDVKLTFEIDDDEFLEIKSAGRSDESKEKGKTHYVSLRTKKTIDSDVNKTFKITATDNGNNKGEAEVTLIVKSSKY